MTAITKAQVVNGKTYPYTTGAITTNGKFSFTYGAIEARIYLPGSGGTIDNWPSFWTDGQSWPTDGEMDIAEGLGGGASYHFHWGTPSSPQQSGSPVAGDFTGWHTYAANWQPGRVDFYYDGARVGTITTGITSSPMYIILNYAVSQTFGGPIVTPATMKVDYVRVWQ